MPLYKYLGGILKRDGGLAKSEDCCCGCGCPNPPPTLTATLSGPLSGSGTLTRGPEGFAYTSESIPITGCEDAFGAPGVVEAIIQIDCVPGDPDTLRVHVIISGALCPFEFTADTTSYSCNPIHISVSEIMNSSFGGGCPCQGELITIDITE